MKPTTVQHLEEPTEVKPLPAPRRETADRREPAQVIPLPKKPNAAGMAVEAVVLAVIVFAFAVAGHRAAMLQVSPVNSCSAEELAGK